MTDADYARKLAELDRLLNDPDVPMQPARVWALLAETARRDLADAGAAQPLPWMHLPGALAGSRIFGGEPHGRRVGDGK